MIKKEKIFNKIDFLIEIKKSFVTKVCNYGLCSVLTEEKWEEIVYKCLCESVTESQIKELETMGLNKEEIYKKLNVGDKCGSCVKNKTKEE